MGFGRFVIARNAPGSIAHVYWASFLITGLSPVIGALPLAQMVALHMGKVKRRPSHPLRDQAVRMLMRGEATPAEIRQTLHVSRQLIYYWCKAAGITGKTTQARKAHILRLLLKGVQSEDREVNALRARLRAPRPTWRQMKAAHDAKLEREKTDVAIS